jgi:hypothetical protein
VFLYLTGKTLKTKRLGLLAALLYAVYPGIIFSNRTGFTYSLFAAAAIITFYLIVSFLQTKKIKYFYLASLFAGISFVISFFGLAVLISVFLVGVFKSPKKLLISCAIMAILPLVYLVTMYKISTANFVHDFLYLISRPDVSGFSLETIKISYLNLAKDNVYIIAGVLGLLLLPKPSRVWGFVFLLLMSFFEFKFRSGYWQYISTYLFILVLGTAVIFDFLFEKTEGVKNLHSRNLLLIIIFVGFYVLILHLAFFNITRIVNKTWYNYGKGEELFSPDSLDDLDKVVSFIKQNTTPNEVIMVSPHIAWKFPNLTTDPILAHVYYDRSTVFWPADMGKTGRAVYNCSIDNTKYYIEDKFDRNWFMGQIGVRDTIAKDIYQSNNEWPLAYQQGEFKVYENLKYWQKHH